MRPLNRESRSAPIVPADLTPREDMVPQPPGENEKRAANWYNARKGSNNSSSSSGNSSSSSGGSSHNNTNGASSELRQRASDMTSLDMLKLLQALNRHHDGGSSKNGNGNKSSAAASTAGDTSTEGGSSNNNGNSDSDVQEQHSSSSNDDNNTDNDTNNTALPASSAQQLADSLISNDIGSLECFLADQQQQQQQQKKGKKKKQVGGGQGGNSGTHNDSTSGASRDASSGITFECESFADGDDDQHDAADVFDDIDETAAAAAAAALEVEAAAAAADEAAAAASTRSGSSSATASSAAGEADADADDVATASSTSFSSTTNSMKIDPRYLRSYAESVPLPWNTFLRLRRSWGLITLSEEQEADVFQAIVQIPQGVGSIHDSLAFVTEFIYKHCPDLRSYTSKLTNKSSSLSTRQQRRRAEQQQQQSSEEGSIPALPGTTLLLLAVITGHSRLCYECLKLGANPNNCNFLTEVDAADNNLRHGYSPMFMACLCEQTEIMTMLKQHGGSIHVSDRWGRTPLHAAAAMGSKEVIQWLINEGAPRKVVDIDLQKPGEVCEGKVIPELAIPSVLFRPLNEPQECHCLSKKMAGQCGCIDDMTDQWYRDRLTSSWSKNFNFVRDELLASQPSTIAGALAHAQLKRFQGGGTSTTTPSTNGSTTTTTQQQRQNSSTTNGR